MLQSNGSSPKLYKPVRDTPDQPTFFPTLSDHSKMPSQQVFNNKDGAAYTTSNGAAVTEPYAAQKVGPIGPLLLQGASDRTLIVITEH